MAVPTTPQFQDCLGSVFGKVDVPRMNGADDVPDAQLSAAAVRIVRHLKRESRVEPNV